MRIQHSYLRSACGPLPGVAGQPTANKGEVFFLRGTVTEQSVGKPRPALRAFFSQTSVSELYWRCL